MITRYNWLVFLTSHAFVNAFWHVYLLKNIIIIESVDANDTKEKANMKKVE